MHLLCTSVLDQTSLVKSCLKRPKKKKRHLQHSCFRSCKCSLKVNQASPADPNVLSRMLWTINYAFNPAIRIAVMVAAIRVSHRVTKLPILARELVKWTKGKTAKMRVKERITWLSTSNFPAAAFPPTAATMKFRKFKNFWRHFSLSEKQIRPKENVWNSTSSLTSHNTSAASLFLVVGNEWPNNNGAIAKLFLPLYFWEAVDSHRTEFSVSHASV